MAASPIEAASEQGSPRRPADTSTGSQGPAPGTNGPATKAKNGRPVHYPIQLKVNLSQAQYAALKRVCERWGIPEGIGARIGITQFCTQQGEYRGGNGNAA